MVKEIFPSSYECDCGYQLDFCEGTRDLKRMTDRKQHWLIADDEKHVVVIAQGRAVDIRRPANRRNEVDRWPLMRRTLDAAERAQRPSNELSLQVRAR